MPKSPKPKKSKDSPAKSQEPGRKPAPALPNYFTLASGNPQVLQKLMGSAQAGYLENPLPYLFKERLFIHLSRFCPVRYCIARHVGFLLGIGRLFSDPTVPTQNVDDVVRLLRRSFPRGPDLNSCLSLCADCPAPMAEMPASDSELEKAVFALAGHVFLKTPDFLPSLNALARLFGPVRFQDFLWFLSFARTAHYWTETHPDIEFDADIKELLATHQALADCIMNDPECRDNVSQSILDELPELRLKAERATGLLAAIVDSSEDAIISETPEGVITSWNAGAQRLYGYSANEVVGQHITLIIPPDRHDEENRILGRIRLGEQIAHFDTVRMRKDKSHIDVSLAVSPVRDATGKILGASKIARDISHRTRAERALRESEERYRALADALDNQVQARTQELEIRNSELRGLSARLLESQDIERRHIARELHDSAGQTLAGLGLLLAQLSQKVKKNSAGVDKGFADADNLVQTLSQEIRTASYLLHPPTLDASGLASALNWYVEGIQQRSGLAIMLTIERDFGRLASDVELVIFRIVQESLTNIIRHSGSKTAAIRVVRDRDIVRVEVEDQGHGISAEKLSKIQAQGTGVGIGGMRERLRYLGGAILISSTAKGTRILATLPAKSVEAPQIVQ